MITRDKQQNMVSSCQEENHRRMVSEKQRRTTYQMNPGKERPIKGGAQQQISSSKATIQESSPPAVEQLNK